MPITSLPQQETYKSPDIFKKTLGRAYDVGRSLQQTRQPAPATRFPQLAGAVRGAGAQPSATGSPLEMFKNLGTQTVPYGGQTKFERFHPGVDLAAKMGTPIPSFTAGEVTGMRTGQVQGSPDFGNFVIITDDQGNQHRFSHLHNSLVKIGQQIGIGEQIGTMGNTGQTYSLYGGSGSHLDYRIRDNFRRFVNPSEFYKK